MKRIDQLKDNLPKTEKSIRAAFQDCQKEKRVIEKVKTFVEVSQENYKEYLDSSITALDAAKVLLDNKKYEWVIVPAYSAMFQAGNALLIKETGKECRDHFCLLVSLLKLKTIDAENVQSLAYLKDKLDHDGISFASKLRLVRSSVIYKPSSTYNEKDIAEQVFSRAQAFVNTIVGMLL